MRKLGLWGTLSALGPSRTGITRITGEVSKVLQENDEPVVVLSARPWISPVLFALANPVSL